MARCQKAQAEGRLYIEGHFAHLTGYNGTQDLGNLPVNRLKNRPKCFSLEHYPAGTTVCRAWLRWMDSARSRCSVIQRRAASGSWARIAWRMPAWELMAFE